MRACLLLILLAAGSQAAVIQGLITDEETRNPLARTHVTLIPLPGNPALPVSLLTDDRGVYTFSGVQSGWYLIRAARVGYAVTEYGQSRPGQPGRPFEVTNAAANGDSESRPFVMRHQAAITGAVIDDNEVGIPAWPVSLYTARQPIRRIAQTLTDDRGNFRFGELDAGAYLARSGGGALDSETTLLPSYFKYGTAVTGAEPVRVRLGDTQGFVVIHTVEGQLFELTGNLTAPENARVRLTLITDTGRRLIASAAGPFTAENVPPGQVELLAEGPACGGYRRVAVDRNMFARVDCAPVAPVVVTGLGEDSIVARRIDLDGPGPEHALKAGESLAPGRWEFTVRFAPSRYLVAIQDGENASAPSAPGTAADGWYAIGIGNAPHLRVTLSNKPASITGVVSSASGAVTGTPVFLQLLNQDAPELPAQSWAVRADARGNYEFQGLPPGTYRLMSSFDVDAEDPLAQNRAVTIVLREGGAATQPLDMILQ